MSRAKKFLLPAIAAVAALSLGVGTASADSILVSATTPATTPYGVGETSWNYHASLAGSSSDNTQIQSGDTLVLIDLAAGLDQAATTTVNSIAGWTVSYQAVSPMYNGAFAPPDSAAFTNVVFTYSGPNINYSSNYGFNFSIVSTFGGNGTKLQYGGNDHNLSSGTTESNYGKIIGPSAVPLPAAAWGGLGLLGVLGVARKYRRAKAC